MVWIYYLREKGPVILVSRIAHHTQTLIASSFDISWINMLNLLFWDFTYPLIWKQVSQKNFEVLFIFIQSMMVAVHKILFCFTVWVSRVHEPQLSLMDAIRTCLLYVLLPSWIQTVAKKLAFIFELWHNLNDTFCSSCAVRVHHTTCSERAAVKSINTV